MASRTASRAALLELRGEHQVIQDGHRFLDEKRALLAHEVLARLKEFDALLGEFRDQEHEAIEALAHAVTADGLEALQLCAPLGATGGALVQQRGSFLGVPTVTTASFEADPGDNAKSSATDPMPSAAAERCAAAFLAVSGHALELATELGNLLRLVREFRRTQRRVRALEKVVLPELHDEAMRMEDALEEIDQEDAIRVRLAGRGRKDGSGH